MDLATPDHSYLKPKRPRERSGVETTPSITAQQRPHNLKSDEELLQSAQTLLAGAAARGIVKRRETHLSCTNKINKSFEKKNNDAVKGVVLNGSGGEGEIGYYVKLSPNDYMILVPENKTPFTFYCYKYSTDPKQNKENLAELLKRKEHYRAYDTIVNSIPGSAGLQKI